MQKVKLFVTASAICFALTGAALSQRQSESAAILYMAGYLNSTCIQATESIPATCSITGSGQQCSVLVTDSWGNSAWVWGYGSPVVTNLCLLPLKEVL